MAKLCRRCSKDFEHKDYRQLYCKDCLKIATRERKYKTLKLFYQRNPKYWRKWLNTENGKKSHEKYLRSETKKKLNEKWNKSEKGKQYNDDYSKNWNRRKRLEIIEKLGGKCVKCGYDKDWRALQVDHITGGGGKEIRGFKTRQYLQIVLKNIAGKYQLLCANCNWIKRYEENECKRK